MARATAEKHPEPAIGEVPPPALHEGSPEQPLGIESAPKDGRWIEATIDGVAWVRVRWYQTRVRAAGSIAWVKASCWSTSDPAKLMHRLDNPKAWRPC